MHDEDGFLAAIRLAPADDVLRLVFADWLDEQDEPSCKPKADFIRLELRMVESSERSLHHVHRLDRLHQLAKQLDLHWLAVVSHAKIEVCRVPFPSECPMQWAKLAPTSDARVRRCEHCKNQVHYCDTLQEAQAHVANGTRVALTLALDREMDDLFPPPLTFPWRFGRAKPRQRDTNRTRSRNIQRENWEEME
jgi:uncharacterized protein (TIGR02996 family)